MLKDYLSISVYDSIKAVFKEIVENIQKTRDAMKAISDAKSLVTPKHVEDAVQAADKAKDTVLKSKISATNLCRTRCSESRQSCICISRSYC